jgi:hypothetical protein
MHDCQLCSWDTHVEALANRINCACIEIGIPLRIITLEDAEQLLFDAVKWNKTCSLQFLQLIKITSKLYEKWCDDNSDALQYVYNALDCIDEDVCYQDWCRLAFKLRIYH